MFSTLSSMFGQNFSKKQWIVRFW